MSIVITYIILGVVTVLAVFALICLFTSEKNTILSGKYQISPIIDNDVFKLVIYENGFKTKEYYINYCFYNLFYGKPLISISYLKIPFMKYAFITSISIGTTKII